ncbi:WXG100 family type VII secretion target [Dactylosporangium sp. CA-092794]|uniref:WXG100 family type VII secretion target n=1 Tax=Dactylosporangium sp. CA-092794 TaxID=3239929 RepID=UPI003D8B985A
MSGSEILYQPGLIAELVGEIRAASSATETLQHDINGHASALNAVWDGKNSDGWAAAQKKWNDACDALTRALIDLATATHLGGELMAELEASLATQ